ncbi:hypothetical protein T459_02206 [Capsicum annuum]|uniref:Diacylglycerol O-acyltransferase n=1 Tax=Capsicum annuum TaxID=4072 RepID=A0A2G3AJA4_CAPAN|nr:putative anther-specific protein SF18-like [Capsicum annuum]PHT94324.1 hypothetical protein T459_02206 [Capsicum annuum]
MESIRRRKLGLKPIETNYKSIEVADEEQLSPLARLFHKPNFNIHILTIIGCKLGINPKVFKVDLVHTLAKHPHFSSLQELPDKFVENYIQNLSKTSLDKSKPMWDFHLLNIKASDAEDISVSRCHHPLGDGTSPIFLLLACTRRTADMNKVPTIPRYKKRPINSSEISTKGLQ